ncbi:MAG TPA: hypothetical protein VMR18_04915 [Candidatus Saccharimonadales bacterium]|jgi:hypothetical protein|nr:hypothetical protein [Candidatus Saccharimonadales bacterium]
MLSELLSAPEPNFQLTLRQLEKASGHPSEDIHLSVDISQRVRAKLRLLGLDPSDTDSSELYHALKQRLSEDEVGFRNQLGLKEDAPSVEILSSVQQFISKLDIPKSTFALKLSVAKRLLKKCAPIKAMKQLGYRSVDSMLKHEPIANLYAAAKIYESPSWHKNFKAQYSELKPSDFEPRKISVTFLSARRWEAPAERFSKDQKHATLSFKELGAVVILPVIASIPALAITSVLTMLEDINSIRCSSTFLKLQQVKPDFGKLVAQVSEHEPYTSVQLAGQNLPWRVIQYYYSAVEKVLVPELFEPHVQAEDLQLVKSEAALAKAVPSLEFWLDTTNLAHVNHGQVVSLNMLDVALCVTNDLSFSDRIVHYVQDKVWRDLFSRYLNQNNLDQVIAQLGNSQLEPEPALVENVS